MSGTEQVVALVERIRPILTGNAPQVQGAVLAELLASWLAGHIDRSDNPQTDALREELLQHHLVVVRALVPVNAAQIHGGHAA